MTLFGYQVKLHMVVKIRKVQQQPSCLLLFSTHLLKQSRGRHLSEAAITLENQLTVGKVILDPRNIKGVGGWHNPSLHLPIKTQLYPREKEEQIALIRLTASLHLTENQDITNQFGAKVSYDFINNLQNRSTVWTYPSEGGAQLLFNLTHEQIKQLEDLRLKPNGYLFLHLEPIIARLKPTEQAFLTIGNQQVGVQQVDFAYLWTAAIGTLHIETAEVKWTENIFPNIGYDRYRLVEVSLPTSDILVPKEAIGYFQKAKKYFDEGNHIECLRECRLALEELEKHLKVQNHKLGAAITKKLGWPDQPQLTEQAKFLDSTWVGLFMLANAASHTPSTKSLLPADAHTGFLSIAVMLEYLGQLQ